MRRLLPVLLGAGFIALLTIAANASAQKAKSKYEPPANIEPSAEVMQQIAAKTAQLAAKVAELRKNPKHHELLPDVEIYLRAAENIVRYKEFYNKASGQWTLECLDTGMNRARQLADGKTPWTTLEKRNVLRAYRSSVDGTAQPYGVTYPLEYGKDPKRKWRVDVVLHGRGSTLTEVSFLNSHNGKRKVEGDQDWVQIDIYGRGNNAYRWAGETDVLEAMFAYERGERDAGRDVLDRDDFIKGIQRRPVLRGFSMGGAGTWHIGLRRPDFWSVIGPGAGFTTTHDYAWKGRKELPDYQERCLRIYDAIDYVENAALIPIVAYSGGDDPQKLAADNIEKALKELNIKTMTHLVKPGVGHKFDSDYFQKANTLWAKYAAEGRTRIPFGTSFTTYSTISPSCDGVEIWAMEKQYEKATVHVSTNFKAEIVDKKGKTDSETSVTTKNVRWLALGRFLSLVSKNIDLDGQKFKNVEFDFPYSAIFVKKDGRWSLVKYETISEEAGKGTTKRTGLQGPIDDAFSQPFVCVLGSGDTFHPATLKFVDAKVAAFKYDWGKHWRGELPTIGDYAVTPNEVMDKNLILFGDPQSNLVLAQILPKLPLRWTKDEIEFAGKTYKASEHVPVLIFPNPLNPRRYVVLNTGHTFPSEDYVKTNALLYPRLGDYAILRMTPTAKDAAAYEVATAGLFDEFWRVEKK